MSETYFSLLPSELISLLFLYFPAEELYILLPQLDNLKDFNKLFSSKSFWNTLWRRDISSFITPPKMTSTYNTYISNYKRFFNPSKRDENIIFFTIDGYDRLLYPLLKDKNDYENVMAIAAANGHLPMVKDMIKKGARNYNRALQSATSTDKIDIVDFMINLGATNLNSALINAAEKGYADIVELLLRSGADNYLEAIRHAGLNNRKEIQDLIRSYQK